MSTFAERLASFTPAWPHTVPSPEALADAGFSHQPTSKQPDAVICQVCKTCLVDWEPEDDPKVEHYFGSKTSKSCMRFASRSDPTLIFVQHPVALPQKDSQASPKDLPASPQIAPTQIAPQTSPALKPSPKDIGFLDPSLQHDFPELCLFHDAHTFCDRIEHCRSESGFLGADILELLPRCLRGEALKWFKQSECQDLAACLQAMRATFALAPLEPPLEGPLEGPQAPPEAPPRAPDYHHCKLCNASFSSVARLMRHTQEDVCNRPSCRHCDAVFSSKNRLHQHLREECQKQRHKRSSISPSPSSACSPTCSPKSSSSPSPPPEENRVSLSLSPSPSPSPPPKYRTISPPPPTYGNFLTVEDRYARYAPRYLKIGDLFRMFGRHPATTTKSSIIPAVSTSAAPTIASKHRPIRHRGRCQAKKGDGSSQTAKHLKPSKTPKTTKQQQNQKQKIGFARTSLQPTPYKSVLPLQRSRSMSCSMVTPGSPSFLTSSAPKLATNMHWLPMPHI